MHFYGLPQQINGKKICILNKEYENQNPMLEILRKNNISCINFTLLFNAIKEGIKLFGGIIAENSKQKSPQHIKGIIKMYKIYEEEGGENLVEKDAGNQVG